METGAFKWKLILVFFIFTIYLVLHFYYNLFNLPYFWDELGVYSRAANHLTAHGIGLLPSSLPDELSRGHPILVPFIWGLGFKIFGAKVIVAKVIGAIIYSTGILYIFKIFLLIFNPKYSFLFSFLIFIQPCFLAQSVLILPEIPLMVASIIAFYYYIKGQYALSSIALIVSLFIKESAVILPLALYFIDILINRFKFKNFVFLLLLPFLFIVSFFVVQYYQRGYVFYPLHTSLVKLKMYYIKERYRDLSKFVFLGQGRDFIWFFLPLMFILYHLIKFRKTALNNFRINFNVQAPNFKLYLTLLVLLVAGVSFSVLNYYITRYSLYYMVFLYIAFFMLFFREVKWHLVHYISILVLVTSALFYNNDNHYTDVNFSYVNHIKSCQKTMDYLNVPENSNKSIAMDFPFSITTWDRHLGYFNDLYFKLSVIGDPADMKADYYVFTFPGNIDNLKKYESNLILVKKIESGYAYVNIYKRKVNNSP